MAILDSGPVAFEIRVLSAWAHGQVYALDLRWHGGSVLNPALVHAGGDIFGAAPPGWLVCRGREYELPSPFSSGPPTYGSAAPAFGRRIRTHPFGSN